MFYRKFKLYVSTDGTTYTEKKSYGGSAGKHLFDNAPRRMIIFVQQQGTDAPTLVSTLYNNTGKSVTALSRTNAGVYVITFNNTDTNLFFRLNADPYLSPSGTLGFNSFAGYLAHSINDTYSSTQVSFYQTNENGVLADDTILYDGAYLEIFMHSTVY